MTRARTPSRQASAYLAVAIAVAVSAVATQGAVMAATCPRPLGSAVRHADRETVEAWLAYLSEVAEALKGAGLDRQLLAMVQPPGTGLVATALPVVRLGAPAWEAPARTTPLRDALLALPPPAPISAT